MRKSFVLRLFLALTTLAMFGCVAPPRHARRPILPPPPPPEKAAKNMANDAAVIKTGLKKGANILEKTAEKSLDLLP